MIPARLQRFGKRLIRSREGNVLMLTGLMILILFATGGAAIDFGRQQLVRMKIQQASDAAALAAAAAPDGSTDQNRFDTALRYYNLNFPETFLGIKRPAPSISVGSNITVSAGTDIKANFIRNVGVETLQARGRTVVAAQPGSRIDYDVVMVVDETASTSGPISTTDQTIRIKAMRSALTDLANTIVPVKDPSPNVRFGIMGYSSHITSKWGLSSNNADVLEAIRQLDWSCNNYDHFGLQGAFNMLRGGTASTPNGKVAYPPVNGFDCEVHANTDAPISRTKRTAASDSNGISPVKNVIFLTDGDIMTDTPPCKDAWLPGATGIDCYRHPESRDFKPFLQACDALKSMGAHVYVVDFATPPAEAQTAMEQCASTNAKTNQPDFYFAQNLSELNSIFGDIGGTIRKIRISE